MTHVTNTLNPKRRSLPKVTEMRDDHDIHDVHLIERGSPFAGFGMNDVVHLDNGTVISVPYVSSAVIKEVKQILEQKKQNDLYHQRCFMPQPYEVEEVATPSPKKVGKKDYLEFHGSPLGGLGMSDIVHTGKSVVAVPLLPIWS